MGRILEVGLVGFGLAGAVFHAPLITSVTGLHLRSVVTSDPRRQAQARSAFPDIRILETVDELWSSAADHDVAVIATPNATHMPLGLAAIQAGLAVVVDKPLALTAHDGQQLVAAADQQGVLLTVFHNRRWDGDFRTLRRLLDENTLGRVHRFESRFERWRPTLRPGAWRELEPPEAGGGLLLDLGSHLVDQAVVLFGRPHRVYAEVDRRRAGVKGDDDAFVALEHADDVRSHLWASSVAAQPGPRLRVLGSDSAYTKHGVDGQEAALRSGGTPSNPDWGREPAEHWGRAGAEGDLRPVPTEPGAYQEFYAKLRDAVANNGPPPVAPEDGVAVLRILEAARASARSGQTVELT